MPVVLCSAPIYFKIKRKEYSCVIQGYMEYVSLFAHRERLQCLKMSKKGKTDVWHPRVGRHTGCSAWWVFLTGAEGDASPKRPKGPSHDHTHFQSSSVSKKMRFRMEAISMFQTPVSVTRWGESHVSGPGDDFFEENFV